MEKGGGGGGYRFDGVCVNPFEDPLGMYSLGPCEEFGSPGGDFDPADPGSGSGSQMSDQALLDEAMKIALDRLNNFPGCWDNIFPGLKAKGKTPEQLVKDPRIKIGMGSVPYPGWTRGTGGLATRNRYYSTYKGAEITFNIDPKKGDVFSSYIYSNFGVPSLSLLNSIALLAIHELGHAAALLYGPSVTTIVFENRPGVDPWVMDRQSVANDDNVFENCFKPKKK